MATFDLAHKNTAQFEGGYTDNPDDNGNWTGAAKGKGKLIGTNLGITAWELKAFLGHMPTVQDMKNLSHSDAAAIFKSKYWKVLRGDEIKDQEIANSIYDSCVNMGPSQAIKLAQRTLKIPETGRMDDFTLQKLNA